MSQISKLKLSSIEYENKCAVLTNENIRYNEMIKSLNSEVESMQKKLYDE